MNAYETEIRRTASGTIDTEHYIRHCHRQRSLAAHAAIARLLATVANLFGRGRGSATRMESQAATCAHRKMEIRKAA